MDHNKLENSLRDGNTRPPYLAPGQDSGQEATVKTGHGATDWFQIGKLNENLDGCGSNVFFYIYLFQCLNAF